MKQTRYFGLYYLYSINTFVQTLINVEENAVDALHTLWIVYLNGRAKLSVYMPHL